MPWNVSVDAINHIEKYIYKLLEISDPDRYWYILTQVTMSETHALDALMPRLAARSQNQVRPSDLVASEASESLVKPWPLGISGHASA